MNRASSGIVADRLPASFLQEGYFCSADDGVSNYNLALAWRFTGELDRRVLQEALNTLVARHETLRTTLRRSRRGVEQLIWPPSSLETAEIDLAGSGRRGLYKLPRVIRTEAARPFDLRCDDLLRAAMITVSDTEHVLILTFHHAICDGWSTKVLFRDLQQLYSSIGQGRPSLLPQLTIQFGDYASWERTFHHPEYESYWRRNLHGPRRALRLPTDRPWTPGDGFDQAPQSIPTVSPAVVRSLTRLAKQRGASLGMALRAAVAAALVPYASGELIIGDVYANRDRSELQPVVGCVYDYLPLRIHLTPGATFLDMLAAVRDTLGNAHAHRTPLGAVQHALSGNAHERIFDVTVNYLPYSPDAVCDVRTRDRCLRMAELPTMDDKRRVSADRDFAATELLCYTIAVDRRGRGQGMLWGNEKAFLPRTVAHLACELSRVLKEVSVHPDEPVRGLAA